MINLPPHFPNYIPLMGKGTISISGTLTYNGNPVEGATITLGSYVASSTSSGFFKIKNIKKGTSGTLTPTHALYNFPTLWIEPLRDNVDLIGKNFVGTLKTLAGIQRLDTAGSPSPTYSNVNMVDNTAYRTYKSYPHYSNVNGWYLRLWGYCSAGQGSNYKIGCIITNASYYDANAYDANQVLKFINHSNGNIVLRFKSDSFKRPGEVLTLSASQQYDVYLGQKSGWGALDLRGTGPTKFDIEVSNSKGSSDYDIQMLNQGGDVGNDGTKIWDVTYQIVRGGLS